MDFKLLLKERYKEILIFLVCWSIGFYTLRVTAIRIDLDKIAEVHTNVFVLFFFSIGIILLPFLKTLKIGKIIELERDIIETKEELKETKTELRQSITMALSSINTSISAATNSVNITVPGVEEMQKAKEKVQPANLSKQDLLEETLDNMVSKTEGNLNLALVKARMEIEKLMREILKKRTSVEDNVLDLKFLPLTKLFQLVVKEYADFRRYYESFRYVQSVCNAAIHGQQLSYGQGEKALELAIVIIEGLNDLKKINK